MTSYFAPLHAKSAEPMALDMQSLFLSGRVLPFGAKLSVTHVFRSNEKSPVEVVYCFPLPRDASLVSFQISGENFSISSRLERTPDALKRYEQGLEDGSLAALTQQNLDGLVNLTVGNLRPGETVSVRLDLIAGVSLTDSGFRLRFPFTVAPCYQSQMRVSQDEPGIGTIELPDDVAGGVFLPSFHAGASDLHKIGFELQLEPAHGIGEIASPSHAVRVLLKDRAAIGVKLSPDRDVPNRDLVLDVKCDLSTGCAWSDRPSGDRKHFAVVVPSTAFGQPVRTARRVVFLLDRSGSMGGAPIKQARHAIENCLANLSPEDHFGIVAFDNSVERFRPAILPASRENVEEACAFLHTISERGGTELARGVEAAAQLLAGSAGELFLITDGQVFDTSRIVQQARKCEVRLFCLGIGSASQDRFLELLARQTGGICRFVTPSERVDAAAFEVFAAIGGAVATEVHITSANVRPALTGTVFSGTPFTAFGDIDHEADTVAVEWPQGARRVGLEVLSAELDGLIKKLQGTKLIADFETSYDRSDPAARQQLLELSERYGLTSSEMSLVAVVERADDQAGQVPKTKIIPVGMPQDTRFRSYFGRKSRLNVDFACARMPMFRPADESSGILADLDTAYSRAVVRDTPTALEPLLRETIRIIEDYVFGDQSKDANRYINTLLSILTPVRDRLRNKSHKHRLKTLIDYLASELDRTKWIALRQQLEATWPELAKSEPPPAQCEKNELLRAGMPRQEALRTFEKSVNQPGTMFSTDHWLAPKLEQLEGLLSDPIMEDQATALLDVLHERHRMRDLIDWLQGPPMPWQSFFVLRKHAGRLFDPADEISRLDLLEDLRLG
jgi:Ca-activated chloride channel homolog